MKKIKTDMHSHTTFSFDGTSTPTEMAEKAIKEGISFYGISDHFDLEVDLSKVTSKKFLERRNRDTGEYFHALRHVQEDYAGVLNVLVGAEFGYGEEAEVHKKYLEICEKFQPDFIINSVHCQDGVDYYFRSYPNGKLETYREYLRVVRKSIDAPYPYDIVGHICYVMRYVPYEDVAFHLEEFGAEIDDILLAIIHKDKILEVNTSSKQLPTLFLPTENILRRYFELGGRKISFGSDSHSSDRLGDKWNEVIPVLKEIGFTYITVPCKGEHIKVEI